MTKLAAKNLTLIVRSLVSATNFVAFLGVAGFTQAQSYPAKPLRIIVQAGPGSAPDLVTRRLAPPLAASLGKPVIVDNRPGAAGLIAVQEAARSAPDGYTLLYGVSNDVLREFTANAEYTIGRNFVPVTRLTFSPYIIVVHPSVLAGSLKELIDLAKARPGYLTYASAGPGGGLTLLGALFKNIAGIDMLEVPYKSFGAEIPDLLSGQILVAFQTISVVGQHIKSGKLKALAVTQARRSNVFPDVPTTAENGVGAVEASSFGSILAVVGTPQPIIRLLHQHILRAINTPEFKDQSIASGSEIGGESPEEFAAFLRAESVKWGNLIKTTGIKME